MATKSRGLVSGGRSKPWRQKGTGRARAGTIRAAQFTGGGHVFAKVPRTFDLKVNRKAAKAALRSALAEPRQAGTLALLDAATFEAPSTKAARELRRVGRPRRCRSWSCSTTDEVERGQVVPQPAAGRVVAPSELEVAAVVWARSLVVSEAALPLVETRAR